MIRSPRLGGFEIKMPMSGKWARRRAVGVSSLPYVWSSQLLMWRGRSPDATAIQRITSITILAKAQLLEKWYAADR